MTCNTPVRDSTTPLFPFFHLLLRLFIILILPLALPCSTLAQDPPAQTQSSNTPPASNPKPEISMHDSETTFKVRVNLVQVRVVVRDASGKPVENLHRQDFEIYDQGKLQAITTFEVDTPASRRERIEAALKTQVSGPQSPEEAKISIPERFIALVFDDVHLSTEDTLRVRTAASKFLDGLLPSDRVAVYCSSGACAPQEFTSDKQLLEKAIQSILPHHILGTATAGHTTQTAYGAPITVSTDNAPITEAVNDVAYAHLGEIIRRLAAMPGQRVLLLVSPGFGADYQSATGVGVTLSDVSGIVGSANRYGVVINTLDARGLYTPSFLSASASPTDSGVTGQSIGNSVGGDFENSIVLQDFAAGTGGRFFQNSNDLAGGMALLGSSPEVSYLLGFSPQNQKANGQFHILKVKLADKLKYDVQARRGYFAASKVDDPREQARAEMEDAIYSQGEIQDFPLELQTQYFTAGDSDVRLSVVSRLGLSTVRFRKVDDRNQDSFVIATAIFDENGDLVTGAVKNVELNLLDSTLTRLSHSGLTVKSSFPLKPGKYIVRQVVRDSEGSQMAARNGVVSLPF